MTTENHEQTRCPTCDASLKAFHHTLTPGLVSVLIKCVQYVHAHNKNVFHLQDDLHLSFKENSNISKLRVHGLLAKVDGKPGFWLITKRGGAFLRGEISVSLRVKTFRNRVIDHSPELVHIDELKGKIPAFEQEFAFEVQKVEAGREPIKSDPIGSWSGSGLHQEEVQQQ